MIRSTTAELYRFLASRLWLWSLLAAVVLGGGFTAMFAFVGPENFDPPMPSLATGEGVLMMLGLTTLTLFVPALIGALAVTGEYRHRTIGHTFLTEPRRGRVLLAKLCALTVIGAGYAVTVSVMTLASLYGATAAAGTELGASLGHVLTALAASSGAAVAYTLIGAGIGALARRQLVAVGVVMGWFAFGEILTLALPGLNAAYPYLPGGASAALTDFGYLADTVAAETGRATALLSPVAGLLVLLAYAGAAGVLAVATSLRRDVT
ncbi:MAG TPA: hypothetical protein VFU12_17075 [Glycomyces sp.]|nr:hypothetical protein [Glycomyces sp.]